MSLDPQAHPSRPGGREWPEADFAVTYFSDDSVAPVVEPA